MISNQTYQHVRDESRDEVSNSERDARYEEKMSSYDVAAMSTMKRIKNRY